ncbi:MAG TPA: hypothetical protein HA286_06640 [Candidatus Poseidoniaceae archaeon]|nr:MAG TPA: hypothetical protein D7H96_06610 [Candidatus Poseidoniales archaeon]HIH53946.1 hypothetical protein [Candidatus Poseidoniaceae archaeon]
MARWPWKRGRDARLLGRWYGEQAEEEWVHQRCRLAVACIDEGVNVADLGCGLQVLREHLHASCTYTGYDLGDMHPDNVILDLDEAFTLPQEHDVAVLLGVLEFLADPQAALARVVEAVDAVVLSFVCVHEASEADVKRREAVGAKHHWSEDDLAERLHGLGLTVTQRHLVWERPGERHVVLGLTSAD